MLKIVRSFVAGLVLLAGAWSAHAAALSFSGTFLHDDDIRLFPFITGTAGAVTIETFGFAGGTDATGTVVPRGGFDPVFGLFNFAGVLLAIGDDGASRIDPTTNPAPEAFDSLLTILLPAGNYIIALGEFDNFAIGPNLSNGFLESGNGDFTAAFGCGNPRFCDINGNARNGNFDLSVSGPTVPEPGSLALCAIGAYGFWFSRRRRSRTGQ